MKCQKHLFSLEEGIHYLNNAYKAPLLKSAEEAGINALIRERNPFHISQEDFFNDAEKVRTLFSQMVNCPADQVAITPSTSYVLRTVLQNIKGKKNGQAVITEDEFPSSYYALQRWCNENDNDLKVIGCPDSEDAALAWNADILSAINEHTSIVIMSNVHWINGIRFDLEKISKKCEEHKVRLLIDGTQSVGALPLDLSKIKVDCLYVAAYKWMMGPYSVCMMYLSEDFNEGQPLEDAWMNRTNANDFSSLTNYTDELLGGAQRYNVGETSNFILLPVLKAALEQVNKWGPENIQNYSKEISAPLFDYLISKGYHPGPNENFSYHLFGVSLENANSTERLESALKSNNVILSRRDKFLRISLNVFNDAEDVQALIRALDEGLG